MKLPLLIYIKGFPGNFATEFPWILSLSGNGSNQLILIEQLSKHVSTWKLFQIDCRNARLTILPFVVSQSLGSLMFPHHQKDKLNTIVKYYIESESRNGKSMQFFSSRLGQQIDQTSYAYSHLQKFLQPEKTHCTTILSNRFICHYSKTFCVLIAIFVLARKAACE